MTKHPITHLIVDTSSTNENDNGDCDYCLIGMTAPYIAYLLDYMGQIRRLHRADDGVYSLELWDAGPAYFRNNGKLAEIRDVDGNLAGEVPRGEPILLAAAPQFNEDDFQRVECQTVQVISEDVWWAAYVKHANIRIETAHVEKKTLLRILRSFGGVRQPLNQVKPGPVHPAVRGIHDLLYLDMKNGREFYNADKNWDADTLDQIAKVVAKFIPRPHQIEP